MSKNDEKIQKLLKAVEKQKQDMGKRPRVSFETNGLFVTAAGTKLNLNTVANTDILVGHLAFLLGKETFAAKAAEMLGVEDQPLMWAGNSISDWAGDFRQQISLIKWRAKKKKLDALNQKLGKLMSEDARTANELSEIEKLLG